jgi:hypothetical protein
MTTLTESMKGLVSDIASSREDRQAWLGALRANVRSFRRDTAAAIRREMRAASRERKAWVSSVRDEIGQMRGQLSSDFRSARRAWRGVTAAKSAPRAARSSARAKRSR